MDQEAGGCIGRLAWAATSHVYSSVRRTARRALATLAVEDSDQRGGLTEHRRPVKPQEMMHAWAKSGYHSHKRQSGSDAEMDV